LEAPLGAIPGKVLGSSPRIDLCQGESGSGASLGAIIVKSDRTFRRSAMVWCSEANCCVLSKSDSACADIVRPRVESEGKLRMVSVHGGCASNDARIPGSKARGQGSRAREGHSVDALAPGGDEGRGTLRKATGSREQALIRGSPNGATHPFGVSSHKSIVWRGKPGELKYLSTRRKRHQPRFR
jgi:hypothetical protein